MKKKLLLSSALVGLVAVTGAHAETKVTGNFEQTFKSVTDDASAGKASADGFGSELNMGLSSSAELDNGMTASFGFNVESDGTNGGAMENDSYYLSIGMSDAVSFTIGQDNGNNLSGSAVPHVSDTASTVVDGGYHNLGIAEKDGHDYQHIRTDIKGAGGTFTLRYVPSAGGQKAAHSGTAGDDGNSGYDVIYKGSLGVDGLSIVAGQAKIDQDKLSGATDPVDIVLTKLGVGYNFGSFAVGVEMQDSETDSREDSSSGTQGQKDEEDSVVVGATMALSDKVSVGIARYMSERTDNGVKDTDEETTNMVSLGYSLGGIALDINYAQTENFNFTNQDRDSLQIRTIQKF